MIADIAAARARREVIRNALVDEIRKMSVLPIEMVALLRAYDQATREFKDVFEAHRQELKP